MTTQTQHKKSIPVVDIDSHILEPVAIWDQFVDPAYRASAKSAFYYEFSDIGPDVVVVNGKPAPAMRHNALNRLAIYRPGLTAKEIGSMDPRKPHPITAGAQDAKARIKDMDAMGIDQALIFPTLFAEYFPVVENPDVAAALARGYNDWVRQFCSAAPDRLFPVAILPMQSATLAIREARRIAALGFKAAFIRPSFFHGKFPNHRDYDGLWSTLEADGVAACMHPSPGSANPDWTSEGPFIERMAANLHIGHPIAETVAPGMDNGLFLSAVCFFGHMETYPKLKLSFVHSGAYWAPLAIEKSETYLWLLPQAKIVSLEPEHVWHQRPSLVGFDTWESSVRRLADEYHDVAAWGSHYPHHDATDAWEAIRNLEQAGLAGDIVRGYMGGNAAKFYGLPTKVTA
ncbi:MAG: amidohydrolase family protein [Chloroflexi bacterium]|nr:amidohydrolase family protein [Chloroflexota bacterium]